MGQGSLKVGDFTVLCEDGLNYKVMGVHKVSRGKHKDKVCEYRVGYYPTLVLALTAIYERMLYHSCKGELADVIQRLEKAKAEIFEVVGSLKLG